MNINWNFSYSALIKKITYKHDLDICTYLFNIKKQIEDAVHSLMIFHPIRYAVDNIKIIKIM